MHVHTLNNYDHGDTGEQRRLAGSLNRWTPTPGGGNNVAQSTEQRQIHTRNVHVALTAQRNGQSKQPNHQGQRLIKTGRHKRRGNHVHLYYVLRLCP